MHVHHTMCTHRHSSILGSCATVTSSSCLSPRILSKSLCLMDNVEHIEFQCSGHSGDTKSQGRGTHRSLACSCHAFRESPRRRACAQQVMNTLTADCFPPHHCPTPSPVTMEERNDLLVAQKSLIFTLFKIKWLLFNDTCRHI